MNILNIKKVNIGLIDDSDLIREMLSEWISENEQCNILFKLNNGAFVQEMIEKYKPDILVLDDAMPIKGGFDVLRDLNKLNKEDRPYVIMMSDIRDDFISEVAINNGANDFIYKPVTKNTILARISMYCTCFNLGIKFENKKEDIKFKDYEKLRKMTYNLIEKDRKINILNEVNKLLLKSNFSTSHLGFSHMINAIEIIILKYGSDCTMSKHIYPEIAKEKGLSEYSIEYDIRHAITEAWKKTIIKNQIRGSLFERYKKRPSNAELLKYIVNIIEMKQYGC